MITKDITITEKHAFNAVIHHPLQAYEWGEFRKRTNIKVIRKGLYDHQTLQSGFQLTLHKIPHTPFSIGYLPKGSLPTDILLNELKKIGKEQNCIFIQLEPSVEKKEADIPSFLKQYPSLQSS